MTTLTITLELPTDEQLANEANDNLIATWGEFKRILPYWLPASDGLEIRKGLGDRKIQQNLRIGKLTVDVTDPYVPTREFAPGTVVVRKDNDDRDSTTFVRTDTPGRWTRVYNAGPAHLTGAGGDWDEYIRMDIAAGTATIIFDPTQN